MPFSLQNQDVYTLVVDIDEDGFKDLKRIGLVDGDKQLYFVSDTEIAVMVDQAKRYGSLFKKPDYAELKSRLRECEVVINAEVESFSETDKRLVVSFLNKSEVSIPLVGARIEWKYDPPRVQPRGSDASSSIIEIQEVSGRVSLDCRTSLATPVAPGEKVEFYAHPDIAGALIQTLFDDVKDQDVGVSVGPITGLGWNAQGHPTLIL